MWSDAVDRRRILRVGTLHTQPNRKVEGAIAFLQQKLIYVLRLAGYGVVKLAWLGKTDIFEERHDIFNRRVIRPRCEAVGKQPIVKAAGVVDHLISKYAILLIPTLRLLKSVLNSRTVR